MDSGEGGNVDNLPLINKLNCVYWKSQMRAFLWSTKTLPDNIVTLKPMNEWMNEERKELE